MKYDHKEIEKSVPADDATLFVQDPTDYLGTHAFSILINTEDPAVRLEAIKVLERLYEDIF